MLLSRLFILINVLMTYASWFAVAILASQGKPLLAVLPSLGTAGLHLLLTPKKQRHKELKIQGFAGLFGFLVESAFLSAGVTEYPIGSLILGILPPFFMIGLWIAFATTLNTTLVWLHPRPLLTAGFGFLVSGLSYYAGERLGALRLPHPFLQTFFEIGVVWALVLPLLFFLARRA